MTRQTFYRKLRKHGYGRFIMNKSGSLRTPDNICPISDTANKENLQVPQEVLRSRGIMKRSSFDIMIYIEAGEALGLSELNMNQIVTAADNTQESANYDKRIRRALLRAVGLKETT